MTDVTAPPTRRRRARTPATLATAALTVTLLAAGAIPAQAAETQRLWVAIEFAAANLSLTNGVATPQPPGQVDGFDPVVAGDSVALRVSGSVDSEWLFEIRTAVRWRIVEDGIPTNYWIGIEESNNFFDDACRIYRQDGDSLTSVDLEDDSPYSCQHSWEEDPHDSGHRTVTLTIGSRVWTSLSGSVSPAAGLSLDSGHLESQNQRFFVSGTRFGPGTVPVPIPSGQRTEWRAEMRNAEGGEVGDDRGARVDFWYRVVKGGVPTDFWIKGFQHIYNQGVHYNRDYACEVYRGEPFTGGAAALPLAPFECAFTATETGYGDEHLAVEFTVTERHATTVSAIQHRQQAENLISEACSSEEAMQTRCFYIAESTEKIVKDPQIVLGPVINPGPLSETRSRTDTHSRQLGWSITVTSKTGFEIGDLVKQEIWVALGHTGSVTDSVSLTTNLVVPAGYRGWAQWGAAYVRVHGDFFIDVDGEYFRIDDMWADVADLDAGPDGGVIEYKFEPLADPGTPTEPPVATAPVPAKTSLLGTNEGGIRPHTTTAAQGDKVRVLIGLDHAGTWVSAVLHESGTALGWHRVDETGHIHITVPHAVETGLETLSVSTHEGDVIGWHELTIVAGTPPVKGALAVTGQESPAPIAWTAAGLLGAGALMLALMLIRRRRAAASTC